MGRKKTGERDVRKLIRLGGTSTAVTLPIEALRELGWREGQKVTVARMGRDIVIKDWVPPKKNKRSSNKK